MKKIAVFALLGAAFLAKSQYMVVGKDSVSLADFRRDNLASLQNVGVDATVKNVQDYLLLQQLAQEKKADTASDFKNKLASREEELREKYFYPENDIADALNGYMAASETERQVQIFYMQKSAGDANDYRKIYSDVTSGRMSIEDAITKFGKTSPKPLYIKPGVMDAPLYTELQKLPVGGYTKLADSPTYVAFAKLTGMRPSLGYLVFGTLSYPDDANAAALKNKIYADLLAGKKFQEVTKLYGTTDNEKTNGGVVMGSPILPDEVYAALKGHGKGYYTQPLLIDGRYYIFNIYDLEPYRLTEKNQAFFKKEMMGGTYGLQVRDALLARLKSDSSFKESADFQKIKKSYSEFINFKNNNAELYRYKNHRKTFGALKDELSKIKDLQNVPAQSWPELLSASQNQDLMNYYSEDFDRQKIVRDEMDKLRKNLYSQYIFTDYLRRQADADPKAMKDYYDAHRDNFTKEAYAKGRVAILSDEKPAKEIALEMANAAGWDALQKKYYGKLNERKQILAHFETGEMSANADIFKKYGVPFQKGVHSAKVAERTMVVAIDDILPPRVMTFEEAKDDVRDAVTEAKMKEAVAAQRAKTKIIVQSAFIDDLRKNFKK